LQHEQYLIKKYLIRYPNANNMPIATKNKIYFIFNKLTIFEKVKTFRGGPIFQ